MTPDDLRTLLLKLDVPIEWYDHAPVRTVKESIALCEHIPGTHTKSILVEIKDTGDHALVTLPENKRVNTNALARAFGARRASLAHEERLKQLLKTSPGEVSPFSLLNDTQKIVTAVFDHDLVGQNLINIHPLTNKATIGLPWDGIAKVLTAYRTPVHIFDGLHLFCPQGDNYE